jgi:glycine cleavage system H lipoate-binding protein
MFPWNYGFEWNAGHVIFLGAFYTVVVVVATTLISALLRARRELGTHHEEAIRWESDFHDLPAADRNCRHVLTGEFRHRECPNGFDCRRCETHTRWIASHPAPAAVESEEDILGMSFPLDRYYHRGHAWVSPQPDGTVTIGLDELGSRLVGPPEAIELPQPGSTIHVNGMAFRLRKRHANVRVLAPVDGQVVETGSPERGWLLKVKPAASGEPAFRHLLRGAEVRPWLMREMERLQIALTAEGAAPALADGGVPVADISASYPQADWDSVCGEMFLMG